MYCPKFKHLCETDSDNLKTMISQKLRRRLFSISPQEASFTVRGFDAAAPVREHLEAVGDTFLQGYQAAIEAESLPDVVRPLDTIASPMRGFAYEGAAMGLALRDFLALGFGRWVRDFLEGPGSSHIYMAHVGIGWWYARLGVPMLRPPASLDSLLGWLVLDGYGFHEGYFHWPRSVARQEAPRRLFGYARRVFDQGLGRSLWFVKGADPGRIAQTISAFAGERRADLWAGVGLACTYAGGVLPAAIEELQTLAGERYRYELAQGAAFAAKARQRARNLLPHTEAACQILCGTSARMAAAITDEALIALPLDDPIPAYEIWRRRIQKQLAKQSQPAGELLPC